MKTVKSSLENVKGFRFLTASDTDDGGDDSGGDKDGDGDEGGSGGGDQGGGQSGGGGGGGGGRSGRNKRGGVRRKRNDQNEDDEFNYGTGATSGPGSDWRSGNHVTLMLVQEKIGPDQYHTSQNCMLILY